MASNNMAALPSFEHNFVMITVGAEKKEYAIHRDRADTSPWFRKTLQTKFKEGLTGTIPMPDDDPNVVHIYLNFLYTGTLPRVVYETLSELYVLGEKLMDVRFKNTVIAAIIRETTTPWYDGECYVPNKEAVNIIYDGTLPGSIARKLMVDLHYKYCGMSSHEDWEYPADFYKDFVHKRAAIWDAMDGVPVGGDFSPKNYQEGMGVQGNVATASLGVESRKRKFEYDDEDSEGSSEEESDDDVDDGDIEASNFVVPDAEAIDEGARASVLG